MTNLHSNQVVLCHECLKPFNLTNDRLILVQQIHPIWECPYCDYPNSKGDLGIG